MTTQSVAASTEVRDLKQKRRVNVLLLVEVQASPGSTVDYDRIVHELEAALEKGPFRPGNPSYSWFVRSAKQAVAP